MIKFIDKMNESWEEFEGEDLPESRYLYTTHIILTDDMYRLVNSTFKTGSFRACYDTKTNTIAMCDVESGIHNDLATLLEEYGYKCYVSFLTFAKKDYKRFSDIERNIDYMEHLVYECQDFYVVVVSDSNINNVKTLFEESELYSLLKCKTVLTEATRSQLMTKSRQGAHYKDTSKGKNRWERRVRSRVANSATQYNRISMDKLFKQDVLELAIDVQGETDKYIVTVKFDNILSEIQHELHNNNDKLEFKVVVVALSRVFNRGDVYLNCTCPDFKYRFNYIADKQNYNSGVRTSGLEWVQAPKITNPGDTLGAGCKHINLVLANINWIYKLTSVIVNYIKYCEKNMQYNYANIIYPAIYGKKYEKPVIQSPADTDPNAEEKAKQEINKQMTLGRNERGRYVKDNPWKFKKKEVSNTQNSEPSVKFGSQEPKDERNISTAELKATDDSTELNERLLYTKTENIITEAKADEEKFRNWIKTQLISELGYNDSAATQKADEYTNFFVKTKQSFKSPENDFYYWIKTNNINLFINVMSIKIDQANEKNKAKAKEQEGAILIYSDANWYVYHITNYEAMKKYGRNTKWCLAGNYNGHEQEGQYWFNFYKGLVDATSDTSRVGTEYYVFINKNDNKKWCVLVNGNRPREIWTEKDTRTLEIPNAPTIKGVYTSPKDKTKMTPEAKALVEKAFSLIAEVIAEDIVYEFDEDEIKANLKNVRAFITFLSDSVYQLDATENDDSLMSYFVYRISDYPEFEDVRALNRAIKLDPDYCWKFLLTATKKEIKKLL